MRRNIHWSDKANKGLADFFEEALIVLVAISLVAIFMCGIFSNIELFVACKDAICRFLIWSAEKFN